MATKKKVKKKSKKVVDKPTINEGNFAQASDGQNGNRVFISIGKTINIGNYESIRIEAGQGMVVENSMESGFEDAKQVCISEVRKTLDELSSMIEDGEIS